MQRLLILMLTALLFSSCKDTIEQKVEDAVIQAMTSGQWTVSNYTKGASDATASFAGYTFQFKENQTVDALKNSSVEKTGTWVGNGTKQTIEAQFSNVTEPLILLNGLWQISKTTWTSVDAYQDVNGEHRVLRLVKQ